MTTAGKRTGDRRARLAGLAAPLLLVVACFASTLVEASVPRGVAAALDGAGRIAPLAMPAALDVVRLEPEIYEPGFGLFAGDELDRALGQGDAISRFALGIATDELDVAGLELASRARELGFHPLQGMDLIDTEPLRGPPEREPKTRIGGLDLSEPFLQREKPRLSLGLQWGCGPDSCGVASEQRFDPLGLAERLPELSRLALERLLRLQAEARAVGPDTGVLSDAASATLNQVVNGVARGLGKASHQVTQIKAPVIREVGQIAGTAAANGMRQAPISAYDAQVAATAGVEGQSIAGVGGAVLQQGLRQGTIQGATAAGELAAEGVAAAVEGQVASRVGALIEDTTIAGKGAKRGPKPKGTGPHNLKIQEVATQVKDGRIIAGGGLKEEREIEILNGYKGARRPDILVERPDGSVYGINVGKTEKRTGLPVKREREAIEDLESAGIEMHFVPYDR